MGSDEEEEEEEPMEKEGKLRRRDTPHHLKNKRINLTSATTDDAEEKVKAILAAKGVGKPATSPSEVSSRENIWVGGDDKGEYKGWHFG